MKDRQLSDIIKSVKPISPEDGLERLARQMHLSQSPILPVVWDGRLMGIVSEDSVITAAVSDESSAATAADIMDKNPVCANIYMTVGQVADTMKSTKLDAVPVIDEYGRFHGVATRSDVLAAMMDVTQPVSIGGMATPLGVHLTTGQVSAGAGNLGLFLTGVSLMLLWEAARATVWLISFGLDRAFHTKLVAMLMSPPTGTAMGLDLIHLAYLPIMMLYLRLSPLSKYHAAEHQVVNTIEAGEELNPEIVKRMPRVHPRCGTNLMAAAAIFIGIAEKFGNEMGLVIAMIVVLLGWKTVGGFLQQYVTTSPGKPKHINNGIKAGQELLEKYRKQPYGNNTAWNRIWNMGIPQVMLGFWVMTAIDAYILPMFGIPSWF